MPLQPPLWEYTFVPSALDFSVVTRGHLNMAQVPRARNMREIKDAQFFFADWGADPAVRPRCLDSVARDGPITTP